MRQKSTGEKELFKEEVGKEKEEEEKKATKQLTK